MARTALPTVPQPEKPLLPTGTKSEAATTPQETTPITGKAVGGRPKKAPEEKRDYKITLSLTQAEGEKISSKAGLAGDATYLYAMLKEQGAFQ
ncbi:MAG: hypothetical protein AAF862_12760 [Pseudomonadota bacterium]